MVNVDNSGVVEVDEVGETWTEFSRSRQLVQELVALRHLQVRGVLHVSRHLLVIHPFVD